jgi:hypothetical protein
MIVDKPQFDTAIQDAEYSQIQEREDSTRIIYYGEDGNQIAEVTTWRDTGETEYVLAD